MKIEDLKKFVQEIVKDATELKNKHTDQKGAPVNYACIFSQSEAQYADLIETVEKFGKIVEQTPKGPLFQIPPLKTVSGVLQLLKIRIPDSTRPERGDADFTVSDYPSFKKKYLSQKGFCLIKKPNFEMLELVDPKFGVRAYFSDPPLDKQLEIK